jgi:hypothetical protein
MTKIVYKPSYRIHEPPWLIWHAKDLFEKANKQGDSSKIIYSCLELRNCLEMVEFRMILASVEEHEREPLKFDAKPRHGINKVNDKVKSLKYKYQTFYRIVCETVGRFGNPFDFSKSAQLKEELSDYVHTYTRTTQELNFDSEYIKKAKNLIRLTIDFLEQVLNKTENTYTLQNLSITALSEEDRKILNDWKAGTIKEEDELREILKKKKRGLIQT